MGFAKPASKSIYPISDDLEEEEEEDFQTVALDDDHWITDPVPDRCLCIHEHCNHILCVATQTHTQILLQHCTRTHWISVKFLISKM